MKFNLSRNIKPVLVIGMLLTFTGYNFAQTPSLTLSAPQVGTQPFTDQACQYISLQPGYSYTATTNEYTSCTVGLCSTPYLPAATGAGFTGNTPPALITSSSTPVGTINGTFDVTTNGAATYSIPLVIPPGTMGMQPSLSVAYNSSGGNGLMGMGWALQGLSSITRVQQNIFDDGQIYPVTLGYSDRFELDGTRLSFAASSPGPNYGSDQAQYHTEIESYQLVTSHGVAGDGPSYFTVLTKDGKTLEYGNTTDSRILANGSTTVLTWLLDKVTDNTGNYMNIYYVNKNATGEYYPDHIDYTGNANAPFIPYNRIVFQYSERNDPITYFIGGSQENVNVLLTNAIMYDAKGNIAHQYSFNYTYDNMYSHLVEVTEAGTDGKAYNSTKINWHNNLSQPINEGTLNIATDAFPTFPFGMHPRVLLTGDYNGDGRTDLVEVEPTNPVIINGAPPGNNFTLFLAGSSINSFTSPITGNYSNGYLGDIHTYSMDPENSSYDPEFGISTAVGSLDINGDGFDDMVLYGYTQSHTGYNDIFRVFDGKSGFSTQYAFDGFPNNTFSNPFRTATGDFDGDGIQDLLVYYTFYDRLYMFSVINGSPRTLVFNGLLDEAQEVTAGDELDANNIYAIDVNGDGRKELLLTGPLYIHIYNLFANGTKSQMFDGTLPNFGTDNYGNFTANDIGNNRGPMPNTTTIYPGDFNGDGKTDLLIYNNFGSVLPNVNGTDGSWIPQNNWFISYSNGTGYGPLIPASGLIADNGPAYGYQYNTWQGLHEYVVADFNGDGKDDIADVGFNFSGGSPVDVNGVNYNGYNMMTIDVYYSNGNLNGPITNSFVHQQYSENFPFKELGPANPISVGDFNGDGHADLLFYAFPGGTNGTEPTRILHFDLNNQADNGINKVTAIANGYNYTTNIYYDNLPDLAANNKYIKGNSSVFPLEDVQWPLYVTEHITQDNGIAGSNETDYQYGGCLYHEQGKGVLGFSNQSIFDLARDRESQNTYAFNNGYLNLVTYYDQLLQETKTSSISTSTPIDDQLYTYVTNVTLPGNGGGFNNIHYNYLSALSDNNQLYGILNNYTYTEDDYGNTTQSTLSNSAVTSTNNYTFEPQPLVGWNGQFPACLNSNTSVTVRPGDPGPNYTPSYTIVNDVYGRPKTKTEAVGLVTNYRYDPNIGNLLHTTMTGDMPTHSTVNVYDPFGRFVIEQTNSLGQNIFNTYDDDYGNILTSKDLNGLLTQYSYDGFGRLIQTITPTGQQIDIARSWDLSNTLANSLYVIRTTQTGAQTFAEYHDKLDSSLREQATAFDGSNINEDIIYNEIGLITSKSEPYIAGVPPVNTFTYDDFNRPHIVTSSGMAVTTYSYTPGSNMFSTVTTYPNGAPTKTFKRVSDASNLVSSITDDVGTRTYTYASCGLPRIINFASNNVTMEYDAFGRQVSINDPDAGLTSYLYDDMSEIIQEQNALQKANSNTHYDLKYDALGRLLTKNESGITNEKNTYSYDNTNGVGLIATATSITNGITCACNYSYDGFSRLQSKTEIIASNPTYITSFQYDALNRITNMTYPDGFAISKSYTNGYLSKISNANTHLPIWTCNTMNEHEQVTFATYGNGGRVNKTYDNKGFLQNIEGDEKNGGSFPVSIMNTEYVFNTGTGNLISRENYIPINPITETFTNDVEDRLTNVSYTSSGSPPPGISMTYNAFGNINSKSDVSNSYVYTSAQPHAVSGLIDPNPVVQTDLQKIAYTPFLKTSQILEQGSSAYPNYNELDYIYGPDHQRKMATYSINNPTNVLQQTIVYCGEYEEINYPLSGILYKVNYVYTPDGLAAIDVMQGLSENLYYVHTDHLGSIMSIFDATPLANKVFEQSFDAWGNYRDPSSWAYLSPANLLSYNPPLWLIRGYTGHEHLNVFGLINMNGRTYDPLIARMLSPDDNVQNPYSTQNYNRYSYCTNNPLRSKDPSGQDEDTWRDVSSNLDAEADDGWVPDGNGGFVWDPNSGSLTATWTNASGQSFYGNEQGTVSTGIQQSDNTTEVTLSYLKDAPNGSNYGSNMTFLGDLIGGFTTLIGGAAEYALKEFPHVGSGFNYGKAIATGGRGLGLVGMGIATFIDIKRASMYNTWGNYGRVGVDVASIGVSFTGVGTPIGAGMATLSAVGAFNPFYDFLDMDQNLYNHTGMVMLPGPLGLTIMRIK